MKVMLDKFEKENIITKLRFVPFSTHRTINNLMSENPT